MLVHLIYERFTVNNLYEGASGSIVVCISPLTSMTSYQCTKFAVRRLKAAKQRECHCLKNISYYNTRKSNGYSINIQRYAFFFSAVVVDEAHRCKLWGDQFREAFSKVGDIMTCKHWVAAGSYTPERN